MEVVKKCSDRLQNAVKEKVRELRWRFLELDWRKLPLMLIPMVVVFYVGDKLGWLYRYCPGDNLISRIVVLVVNAGLAFRSPLPSLNGDDFVSKEYSEEVPAGCGVRFGEMGNAKRYPTFYGCGKF